MRSVNPSHQTLVERDEKAPNQFGCLVRGDIIKACAKLTVVKLVDHHESEGWNGVKWNGDLPGNCQRDRTKVSAKDP